MRPLSLAVLIAALSAGCGGSLLYAQVEEQRLCNTQSAVQFPPAPPATTSVQTPFPFPVPDFLSGLSNGAGTTATLRLVEMDFTATQGLANFNTIDNASMSVTPPSGSSLTAQGLLDYVKDPNHPAGATMALTNAKTVDLSGYQDTSHTINLSLSMSGALPNSAWTADVTGCVYLKARMGL